MSSKMPNLNSMTIPCTCGKRYTVERELREWDGQGSPPQRFLQCPSCGHVWDLRPDVADGRVVEIIGEQCIE